MAGRGTTLIARGTLFQKQASLSFGALDVGSNLLLCAGGRKKQSSAHLNVYQLSQVAALSALFFFIYLAEPVENVKACGCRFFTRCCCRFCVALACKMLPQQMQIEASRSGRFISCQKPTECSSSCSTMPLCQQSAPSDTFCVSYPVRPTGDQHAPLKQFSVLINKLKSPVFIRIRD